MRGSASKSNSIPSQPMQRRVGVPRAPTSSISRTISTDLPRLSPGPERNYFHLDVITPLEVVMANNEALLNQRLVEFVKMTVRFEGAEDWIGYCLWETVEG